MFKNRKEAGLRLAEEIKKLSVENPYLLALPRGGVPVAYEVARTLCLSLDVLIARKLGAPMNPEFAFGAIAEGGGEFIDNETLRLLRLSDTVVDKIREQETERIMELKEVFGSADDTPPVRDRNVIIIDDGIATGSTIVAAARSARKLGAKSVIVAAPIIAAGSEVFQQPDVIDHVVSVWVPQSFRAVGHWYEDFKQVSTHEAQSLLEEYRDHGSNRHSENVQVDVSEGVTLQGCIWRSHNHKGWVVFVHGSGSRFSSPRNNYVASHLAASGYSSLLFDLLTPEEGVNRRLVFDVNYLATRLRDALKWLAHHELDANEQVALFGASTGGGAALMAAASHDTKIAGIISRGGRPDLVGEHLQSVEVPVLLIVGEEDREVLALNKVARDRLLDCTLETVPGATHLFEEPGALDRVIELTEAWLDKHFDVERVSSSLSQKKGATDYRRPH